MRKTILILLLCSLGLTVTAQKINLSKLGSTPGNYYEEIDFEFVGKKIIIPVRIDGEPYRFLFDTGAPNIISRELYEKIRPRVSNSIPVSDVTGRSSLMRVAIVEEIALGNAVFRGVPSLVNLDDDNIVFDCFGIDGFIGSNMLGASIVQIDLPRRKLIVTDRKRNLDLNSASQARLTLRGNQKSPYVAVRLAGEEDARENLLVDTGSGDVYDICMKNYRLLKGRRIFENYGTDTGASSIGIFGAGEASEQHRLLLPSLRLPGFELRNVPLETSSDNNSRIGAGILKYGILTLDYRKRRLYFAPFQAVAESDEKVLDISLTAEGKRLVVGYVWDKALKDKLAYGDLILLIDDKEYDLCEVLRDRERTRDSTSVTLRVQPTEGEVFDIELEKKKLGPAE